MESRYYPSYQALQFADQILDSIAEQTQRPLRARYQGRLGAYWYWRLPAGILVTFRLGFRITEQRWDVLHAEAVTPRVGLFSAADFPFAVYGTLRESPPYIHDLEGDAEWANRLYFQMGRLIEDAIVWMETLLAAALDPQISVPSSFPALTPLEQELVIYAVQELSGRFTVKALHQAFSEKIPHRALSRLAQTWEAAGLLTEHPRRVTIALRTLVEQAASLAT
ncbi:MAG: hypothetical protein MUQ30_06900 [Anaerolineae bacterium]|nr:hypothetical protein [Anaerolineae bacterium]